ncbi:hypothetical protein Q3G72_033579 [Acer saccharum]|nr:hypothetical protein Q3G72_033579 [Acer saccharum]
MEEAISLFHQLLKRNGISWNCIIAGLAHKGSFLALEYVCMMHKEGLKLDEFALPCGLKACSYFNLLAMGKQIHCYVVKSGFECSCFIVLALVDMYSNCNLLSTATKLFDQYSSWDGLALWNSMLSGYIVNEKNKAAFCPLSQIHSSGMCIDSYTFSSTMKVCLNLLNLRLGLQVHGHIVTCGYESDYVVGSILIDLYAKLGNVKNALKLFHMLPNKDIVAWSGLIMGCAKMGLNSLAFSLAWSGLKPNEVTFLGVLSACRHAGWVEEAWTMFKFMKSEYGMEPHLEHYYCVIDLLGQAGRFKEAETLIANMPFEPDKTIWCSMLKACSTQEY